MRRSGKLFRALLLVIFAAVLTPLMHATAEERVVPYITAPRWSFDGSFIAIATNERIEIRNAITNNVIRTLAADPSQVTALAWSPIDNRLASAGLDRLVKIWDIENGQPLRILRGHADSISSVIWSDDGKMLYSAAIQSNPNLFIWDTATGNQLGSHVVGTVFDAAFSPDGSKFASSASLALSIRESAGFTRLARVRWECCATSIQVVIWNADGTKVITGSDNGLVTIWDASNLQIMWQAPANDYMKPDSRQVEDLALSWVRAITLGADGSTVLAVSGDGTLHEWNISTGALVQESKLPPLAAAAWSPYGGRLLTLDPSMLPLGFGAEGVLIYPDEVTLDIVVPNPSLEKLNALAARCVQDGNSALPAVKSLITTPTTAATVSDLVSRVRALPKDAIPPACAADLLAIAEALETR